MKTIFISIIFILMFVPFLYAEHLHSMVDGNKVILPHSESDFIEAEWIINAQKAANKKAEKIIAVAKKETDRQLAFSKLRALGFTDDEISSLFEK